MSEWAIWWVNWWLKWMSEWVNECLKGVSERASEWVSEWVSEWASERANEWVSEWVSEWMSEWVNEWMSEWVNEWMCECVNKRQNRNNKNTGTDMYCLFRTLVQQQWRANICLFAQFRHLIRFFNTSSKLRDHVFTSARLLLGKLQDYLALSSGNNYMFVLVSVSFTIPVCNIATLAGHITSLLSINNVLSIHSWRNKIVCKTGDPRWRDKWGIMKKRPGSVVWAEWNFPLRVGSPLLEIYVWPRDRHGNGW